jgi:phosphohistidine phosphatase SixA
MGSNKHWRQILRHSGSDTYANSFSDPNRDIHADGYSELHAQADSHAKSSAHARTASVAPQHQDRRGRSVSDATL